MQINLKKFRDFNRICTHGLCVNAAVLYYLRYGEWYIGSRSNCWVHLNQWKEWYMKSNTKKYDHVTPVLKNLRWLPVKTNLFFKEAVMAFKWKTGMAPEYLGNKFIFRGDVSRWKTRSSQNLNIPIFKTKTGQRSFSYRTVFVNIWNNLPSEIKLSKCLNNFKCN